MDELENEALTLYLFMDDKLFPQFLEYAASEGWSDLVIFLLETDYLRFHSKEVLAADNERMHSLFQPYVLIERNISGCFDSIVTPSEMCKLKQLISSRVPLVSIYAEVCRRVWNVVIEKSRFIVKSPLWPSIKKSILKDHHIRMEDVLTDSSYRKYFDRFLRHSPGDVSCLQCLLSARSILSRLALYKVPNLEAVGGNYSANTVQSATGSSSFDNNNESLSSSIMRRWRPSKMSVSSTSKVMRPTLTSRGALMAGTTTAASLAGGATSSAECTSTGGSSHGRSSDSAAEELPDNNYSDSYEALKILLDGLRSLQKQYFPAQDTNGQNRQQPVLFNSPATLKCGGKGTSPRPVSPLPASSPNKANRRAFFQEESIDATRNHRNENPTHSVTMLSSRSPATSRIDGSGQKTSEHSSVSKNNAGSTTPRTSPHGDVLTKGYSRSAQSSTKSSGSATLALRRGVGLSGIAIGTSLPNETVVSHNVCSGLSESLRLEIASALATNASVRTHVIDAVDRAFAFACSNILEKLLISLQVEMYNNVCALFNKFEKSDDFTSMVANINGHKCPRIVNYIKKTDYLHARVRFENIVSWMNPECGGSLYIVLGEHTGSSGNSFSYPTEDGIESNDRNQAESPLAKDAALKSQALSSDKLVSSDSSTVMGSPLRGINLCLDDLSISAKIEEDANTERQITAQSATMKRSQIPLAHTSKDRIDEQIDGKGTNSSEKFKHPLVHRPQLVAINLELLVPEKTVLSRQSALDYAQNIRLYAGGAKLSASRLKRSSKEKKKEIPKNYAVHDKALAMLKKSSESAKVTSIEPFNADSLKMRSDNISHRTSYSREFHESLDGNANDPMIYSSGKVKKRQADATKGYSEHSLGDLSVLDGSDKYIRSRELDGDKDPHHAVLLIDNNSEANAHQHISTIDADSSDSTDLNDDRLSNASSEYGGEIHTMGSTFDLEALVRAGSAQNLHKNMLKLEANTDGNVASSFMRSMSTSGMFLQHAMLRSSSAINLAASLNTINAKLHHSHAKCVSAIDLKVLEMKLRKHTTVFAAPNNNNNHQSGSQQKRISQNFSPITGKSNVRNVQDLLIDLILALVGSNCTKENLSEKLQSPIEETFSFFSDATALANLNSVLFRTTPDTANIHRESFQSSSRGFNRKSSQVDANRVNDSFFLNSPSQLPLTQRFQVCVTMKSTVVIDDIGGRSNGILNHIRLAISYAPVVYQRSLTHTLELLSYTVCSLTDHLHSAGIGADNDKAAARKVDNENQSFTNRIRSYEFPLKILYNDFYSDYIQTLTDKFQSQTVENKHMHLEDGIAADSENRVNSHEILRRSKGASSDRGEDGERGIPIASNVNLGSDWRADSPDASVLHNNMKQVRPRSNPFGGTLNNCVELNMAESIYDIYLGTNPDITPLKVRGNKMRIKTIGKPQKKKKFNETHSKDTYDASSVPSKLLNNFRYNAPVSLGWRSASSGDSSFRGASQSISPAEHFQTLSSDNDTSPADCVLISKEYRSIDGMDSANGPKNGRMPALSNHQTSQWSTGTGLTSPTNLSVADKQQGQNPPRYSVTRLCEPIIKHLGALDFSIAAVLSSISTRVMVQILMLVLASRPVILLSTSPTLLTKIQLLIPHLIWPFKIDKTHMIQQILSATELEFFVASCRGDNSAEVNSKLRESNSQIDLECSTGKARKNSWRSAIGKIISLNRSSSKTKIDESIPRSGSKLFTSNDDVRGTLDDDNRDSINERESYLNAQTLSSPSYFRSSTYGGKHNIAKSQSYESNSSFTMTPRGKPSDNNEASSKKGSFSLGTLSKDSLLVSEFNSSTPIQARAGSSEVNTAVEMHAANGRISVSCGTKQNNERVTSKQDYRCNIVGIESRAFYAVREEIRNELAEVMLPAGAPDGRNFVIIDLEAGAVWQPPYPEDNIVASVHAANDLADQVSHQRKSALSSEELFRCSNFVLLRTLLRKVFSINDDYFSFLNRFYSIQKQRFQYKKQSNDPKNPQNMSRNLAADFVRCTVHSNQQLQLAFYCFWSELILRGIPQNLRHYPEQNIISCDIRSLITELLTTVACETDSIEQQHLPPERIISPGSSRLNRMNSTEKAAVEGKKPSFLEFFNEFAVSSQLSDPDNVLPSPGYLASNELAQELQKMNFSEFLEFLREEFTLRNEENNSICHAFYYEFIWQQAPVFCDFIARHHSIVSKWKL